MNSTRYFHNNGLATHDGKNWTMCEGYDGERYQLPLRVTIEQRKPEEIIPDMYAPRTVMKKYLKMQALDDNAVNLYLAGYGVNAIAEAYRQEKGRVKKFLKKEGVLV